MNNANKTTVTPEQLREVEVFLSRIRGSDTKKIARLRAALIRDLEKINAKKQSAR